MSVQKIYTGAGNVFEVGHVGTITTTTITNIFHSTEKRGPIYFNVCSPEPPFIGRTRELKLLDEAIQRNVNSTASIESHITVVSGLGGIGKTQLVREHVTQNKSKYDNNVIWINGDREESIVDTFKLLANDILTIPIVGANGTEKNILSIVRDVYDCFCGENILVVYDNVESMESVGKFLLFGANTRPYFLITSRSRYWHWGIAAIHLSEWQPNEAIDFVSAIIDNARENAEDVRLLADDLQYFPLALRQATSYIFHREDTIAGTQKQHLQHGTLQ
ncbi:uncharacterized protein LOC119079566 isoform X2 [Bradysia coprophila]|uniref:uncharacterized protein LOC119079566 isoform X2 n=1 Tax=Bradysia coprophila TaxID=38358 RepID=UPI00187D8EC6|nr:uncharacterized protein LOC119079566 isoform X2 [Bradysia coprophila]